MNTMTKGERAYQAFNYAAISVLAFLTLYPFWDVIRLSFSSASEAGRMGFSMWPREPSTEGYKFVLNNHYIWLGYRNTAVRIVIGMAVQLALTILAAFCLSKREFPDRKFWTLAIVFTMFFRGGLIPDYLLVRSLHIDNTILALVLPRAVDTFAMLIMRNYFMTIPKSLEESVRIDGAGEWILLTKIILPLSKPIIMTVALWGIVWHWNAWFDCLIYIRDADKYVLQAILRKIIIDAAPQFNESSGGTLSFIETSQEVVKCASIVVATFPILVIYPFMQKYFIHGMVVGAIKE
ncbi:MAG: hypothetical protein A2Z99_08455 [Treponema sp. GWB1_62_6]|nr:MAG: hypothetical protein A2Y36_15615 [Treponema sp. GWA1_62_8]OHE66807.1 MAG: hypothetical protein A2Z99_08455 [Treponema sp. GWB1_62_6]